MTRLVQIEHPAKGRRVALVDGGTLHLLATHRSVYGFATSAIQTGLPLERLIADDVSDLTLPYDEVYEMRSGWRILPAFDHPNEPTRCLVSGTGLTHLSSGATRAGAQEDAKITDGMRLYQAGVENGRPASGVVGAAPEWFYKGTGPILRGHGDPLVIPNYALGGGEEAEIVAVYIIDPKGAPRRLGFTPGNEFTRSSHPQIELAVSRRRETSRLLHRPRTGDWRGVLIHPRVGFRRASQPAGVVQGNRDRRGTDVP